MLNKYYDDFFKTTLETSVVEVIEEDGKYWHRFLETIFYVESGGMESDSGTINNLVVLGLKYEDGNAWHLLASELTGSVTLQVEFLKRKRMVQIHSASHLLCGIMNKKYHAKTIAFFTHELEAGCEMAFTDFNEELMLSIEKECNDYIIEDLPVQIIYPTLEEAILMAPEDKLDHDELRAVVIGDIDYNMCGCIHVPSLRYIQAIKFMRFEKTTRGYRIYFICGDQLIANIDKQHKALMSAARKLITTTDDVVASIERLQNELKMANNEIATFKQKEIEALALTLSKSEDQVIIKELEDLDIKMFQALSSILTKTYHKSFIGVLNLKDKCHVVITNAGNESYKCNELFKELSNKYALKGGGNPMMSQGGGEYNQNIIISLKSLIIQD